MREPWVGLELAGFQQLDRLQRGIGDRNDLVVFTMQNQRPLGNRLRFLATSDPVCEDDFAAGFARCDEGQSPRCIGERHCDWFARSEPSLPEPPGQSINKF